MIEIVSAGRCIGCGRCVLACPTDVFDATPSGVPVVARQDDCQTCYLCEVYCPVDALFVAPQTAPLPAGSPLRDEAHVAGTGLLGSYRERIGWGGGRTLGARVAVGPPIATPQEPPATPRAA